MVGLPCVATARPSQGHNDRGALIAALESLLATGEPGHTDHDDGERLQRAVDEAIARGDVDAEALAIRAAAPLTASVSRPVSSTRELPSIDFKAFNVLRVRRPATYTARIYASLDQGQYVEVGKILSGKMSSLAVDVVLRGLAAVPGFHVVRLKADLAFIGAEGSGLSAWTERRTLPPLLYAIYDPNTVASAAIRALVYGPAATPVRELDPALGDEPFTAWIGGVLSTRTTNRDSGPDWLSRFCSERTGEAGSRPVTTAICSVAYFQSNAGIGQIWFRTADIRETERGTEWVTLTPPRFEGMAVLESAPQGRLSLLPSLLDAATRPVGDLSILPADIVVSPAAPQPGATANLTITVRNIGQGDLQKSVISVTFGVDPKTRGTSRQFVVDLAAQASFEIRLPVAFADGYGFVLVLARQLGEHAPQDSWTPDPTPDDACAFRVINPRAAPPKYAESIFAAVGGCSSK